MKVKPFCCRTFLWREGVGGVVLESEGWKCRGDDLERSVVLAETELSSAQTEVCDCKKYWQQSGINKSAKITRRLRNLMLPRI